MFKSSILILFVFSQIFAKSNFEKVIGGLPAVPGQFPFSVSLQHSDDKNHFCGAAIITKRWLLTASHCIHWKDPEEFLVYVGSIYLNESGSYYDVEKKADFPTFRDYRRLHDDIGVVKVAKDIEFNKNVQPINLPIGVIVYPGDLATAIGWGRTEFPGGPSSNQLQYLIREVLGTEDCAAALSFNITDQHLCFGSTEGYGLCYGDSGSPLVYVANFKSYVIGVVSWGFPCAVGYPDVFARVSYFLPWIQDQIRSDL